jgi:hypothetical protein
MPLVVILSLAVVKPVQADDLTGAPHDDPKELTPASLQMSAAGAQTGEIAFQPMPAWARGTVMPPLPQALKPMGKKVAVLTTPPVAAPTLAPPGEGATSTALVAKPKVVTPMPNPAPAPTPALIAVSPFLQWIKANPQAAAEQARQQAGAYQADPNAPATAGAPNASTPTGPNAPAAQADGPYWMPPLIDASQFGSGNVTGSGAAIYSTPQR